MEGSEDAFDELGGRVGEGEVRDNLGELAGGKPATPTINTLLTIKIAIVARVRTSR